MKRFLILAGTVAAIAVAFLVTPLAPSVFAATGNAQSDICNGIDANSGGGGGCTSNSGPTLSTVVDVVVNILSVIVGIAAVIMIIVGGFKYITSGGDSGGISSAKSTIIYALVGLVVVALSQSLVKFVLHKVGI